MVYFFISIYQINIKYICQYITNLKKSISLLKSGIQDWERHKIYSCFMQLGSFALPNKSYP